MACPSRRPWTRRVGPPVSTKFFETILPVGALASGRGGVGLSLGELQRLALTRTFVADAAVMVLDEPTAHLDSVCEQTVLQAIRDAADSGVTVVMVGHRRAVLHAADRVVDVRGSAALQPEFDHV